VKLKLDLHDIYNQGDEIEKALKRVFDEAAAKKAPLVEIIPGKGSGQLKKHVLRFLEKNRPPAKHYRLEKDSKNFGRVFVHLRWLAASRRAPPSGPVRDPAPDTRVGDGPPLLVRMRPDWGHNAGRRTPENRCA
jgi:hypothetical protein